MICINATNDSNDSAISSYSSMSLSSSPVRTASIQQLLESPIIKTSSQNREKDSEPDTTSDTTLDVNQNDIIVPESPETTPVGSQETDQLSGCLPLEVANSQEDQINSTISDNNTQNNCRNSLRRQTSVCVSNMSPFNTSIASSPRALAILKNAIKTGFNSNKISDKTTNSNVEEVVKNEFNSNNGVNSPPNSKLFRNSPLSRGSALLKAAKERLEKQEVERSPKFNYNQVLTESNYDRQLTGILRKHELTSSPTSGEPRAKKKKVLFAEPVVSSKLEFKASPSPTFSCFEPIRDLLPDIEVAELTSKQNRVLVHQNSTFDNEFDSDSQHSDSPLLFTEKSKETEALIPSCGQTTSGVDSNNDNQLIDSQNSILEFLISDSQIKTANELMDEKHVLLDESEPTSNSSSQSDDMIFMCSQRIPEFNTPPSSPSTIEVGNQEEPVDSQSSVVTQNLEQKEDPIVMVPMRLSQIKQLYQLFGGLIRQHSNS